MAYLLIDHPVTPFHPIAEIRAWRAQLVAMQAQHAGDETALGTIARALETVDGWLANHPEATA